ncbi:hypothetical protein OHB25_30050 [Streptomyces mirabilis]|uniref:hypothetical protein n=1 Tax=Streptomyces TaxID=1883 RepID=UPI0011637AE3|nr:MULTISPECIES: hypothetical protein [Streptomyces]MCX4610798.1 hypothetical protein [Streptomyces mirabilis]MCX5351014.1 hypothetical protein [Streptomyces mirabilis]QDN89296.1 hypothetical protein FNV61_30360 [Streptomyces sp. RLB3-6]QDO10143.1 hypothetical protein FNV68_31520 [Streptomyces sp. S1D4-23]
MSITQQYFLDTYRARRHGEPAPPAPGAHDWQVARELRDLRRSRAVVAGRPAHGRIRQALGRRLRGRRPHPGC